MTTLADASASHLDDASVPVVASLLLLDKVVLVVSTDDLLVEQADGDAAQYVGGRLDAVFSTDRDRLVRLVQDASTRGRAEALLTMVGADGQLCLFRTVLGRHSEGRVAVVAEDVTEREREDADLKGKRAAIDRTQAVIEFDLNGIILTANDNFLRQMGYELDEIVTQHHRIFCEPAYAARAEYREFWGRLGAGKFESGVYKRLTKSGEEVWLQAIYNPIFDVEGKPYKVVKFATDITATQRAAAEAQGKVAAVDRAQAVIEFDLDGKPVKIVKFASDVTQAKLRNAEFEAKVDALGRSQAMIEFDVEGNIVSANENFQRTVGYSLRELQGQHHSMLCSAEYVTSTEYRDFWLNLRKGEFRSGRIRRVGKYDRPVWLQASYNPILDMSGQATGVVKFASDITAQVELEQSIEAKTEEMTSLLRSLTASIRDVVSGVGDTTELAEATQSDAEQGSRALEEARASIELMQTSTNEIANSVQVIQELARQTNLLAFNASIEAARAGEHGVGFSFVAAEVRKLAERSSEVTAEIVRLIGESTNRVERGSQVSERAGASFQRIVDGTTRTNEAIQAIATSTTEQQTTSEAIQALIEALAAEKSATKP